MSLNIEVDDVAAVLLYDGWHTVKDQSFEMDSYEFSHEDHLRLLGGACKGVCSTGAVWTESDGAQVYCPLTAILAVRTKPPKSRQDHLRRTNAKRVRL